MNASGSQYFTAPNPLYNVSFQSGQLNNFSPTGTQTINGSLDVVFNNAVPEPASVALIGLGLMGLGLSCRLKQA
ncbi:PEP-CTERM sorting domain-containing protein [Noviherbaspirillum sp. 1P10PC]|uniref:PEP-CTERM sorting domain-containing protein n=1 Tax=Noviherbaspirillum sp. 1P10PC TaxID=3132292 RepID=UPI00399F5710